MDDQPSSVFDSWIWHALHSGYAGQQLPVINGAWRVGQRADRHVPAPDEGGGDEVGDLKVNVHQCQWIGGLWRKLAASLGTFALRNPMGALVQGFLSSMVVAVQMILHSQCENERCDAPLQFSAHFSPAFPEKKTDIILQSKSVITVIGVIRCVIRCN